MKKLLILLLDCCGCPDESIERESVNSNATASGTPDTPISDSAAVSPPGSGTQVTGRQAGSMEGHRKSENNSENEDTSSKKPHAFSVDDLSGWNLIDDEDGVKTYVSKESQNGIIALRGETVMPVPIKKLATILNTIEHRKEWVNALSESRIVEGEHTLNRIEYSRAHVPWPFQDRDFLFRAKVTVTKSPPSMLIAMSSIEDSRVPPRDGIVRGEIFHSYYFLTDVTVGDKVATRVVVEIAADPKGAIPSWLVNATQKRWPHQTLLAMSKGASKPDLQVAPEVDEVFR